MTSTAPDCAVCEDEALKDDPMGWLKRRFIVCPYCGNKRCPKASWHLNSCTDSNDVGQVGSFYGPEESWPGTEKDCVVAQFSSRVCPLKGTHSCEEPTHWPVVEKTIDVIRDGVKIGETYDCGEPGCCRSLDDEDGPITNE